MAGKQVRTYLKRAEWQGYQILMRKCGISAYALAVACIRIQLRRMDLLRGPETPDEMFIKELEQKKERT